MDFDIHNKDLASLRRVNRTQGVGIAFLGLSLFVSLVVILSMVGSERIVLTPPNINRTFWVSKDTVSKEYLEEMGAFVSWLILNVSPTDVDWKKKVLLDYVAPDQHSVLKTKMDLESDRLRSHNASTSFLVQQLFGKESTQSVTVSGRLRRQINGLDVGEPEPRRYLIQFKYAGGRLAVQSFQEIEDAQTSQSRSGPVAASAAAR